MAGRFAGVGADDDCDFTLVHGDGAIMQNVRPFAVTTRHGVADQKRATFDLMGRTTFAMGRGHGADTVQIGDRDVLVALVILIGVVAHAPASSLSLFFRPVPR
mgnify:CR=1 FL=1